MSQIFTFAEVVLDDAVIWVDVMSVYVAEHDFKKWNA